tara:strand:- start:124 stop:831 length:708 start_codon:yes stop_codon:yes gene_type:complete
MGYILKILLNIFDYFTLQKVMKKIEFLIGKNFSTLVDVGSHHGEYILSIKKKFNIKEIYGFEPNPIAFEILKKNIINLSGINIYNYGIADTEEDKILNQNIESSSSSINSLNKNSKYYKKKYFLFNFLNLKKVSNSIKIKAINLAKFIDEKKIDKIDLLKIDTEGYEFKVIKGLGKNISKIKLIHLEHHFDDMIIKNYKLSDIHNYLKNNNFIKIFKIKMKFRKSFEYIYKNKNF